MQGRKERDLLSVKAPSRRDTYRAMARMVDTLSFFAILSAIPACTSHPTAVVSPLIYPGSLPPTNTFAGHVKSAAEHLNCRLLFASEAEEELATRHVVSIVEPVRFSQDSLLPFDKPGYEVMAEACGWRIEFSGECSSGIISHQGFRPLRSSGYEYEFLPEVATDEYIHYTYCSVYKVPVEKLEHITTAMVLNGISVATRNAGSHGYAALATPTLGKHYAQWLMECVLQEGHPEERFVDEASLAEMPRLQQCVCINELQRLFEDSPEVLIHWIPEGSVVFISAEGPHSAQAIDKFRGFLAKCIADAKK